MEIKTWDQFLIWLGMQVPVVFVVVSVARWLLLYSDRRHAAELARTDEQHAAVLAEKDKRIAERDERIRDLAAELKKVMELHFPSLKEPRAGDQGGKS
ncbi:MAG: hypothetical protein C0501_13180 [Isosphaera sp.]|nr:hypothetical protein [Isosphaera sp.]